MPVCRSWTNTSVLPFVSPATRLVAVLWNATKRPSAERAAPALAALPSVPSEATLTRSVVPVCRSWTNTSDTLFVSPATRSAAALSKATKRPSAERAEPMLTSVPSVPSEATLTRTVVCAPANRPPRVSSRRVTALRARRCVGCMAPGRCEGAALAVAAFAKHAGHGSPSPSLQRGGPAASRRAPPARRRSSAGTRGPGGRRLRPARPPVRRRPVADVELADLAQAMDEDEAVVLVILDYQYLLRFEH